MWCSGSYKGSQVQIPLGPFVFFNLILLGVRCTWEWEWALRGGGNEKCRTRNGNGRKCWQNMRMDCAGRGERERQNREWE
jgi:hypothetical protein